MIIQFSPPDITQDEIDEVVDTLKSGWITTGPKTKLFEKQIAAYCGTQKAVCMNSATACMEMALRLFGIGPGDEVITSVYTYSASASIAHHVGATIKLVDTDPQSFQMNYVQLEELITPKTKAIIPVDIAGIPCDYETINNIVKRKQTQFIPSINKYQIALNRILVIADAAHSFGASRNNIQAGALCDFTSFSFHAVKNLTTAEGGALTWKCMQSISDDQIYDELMLLALHGQNKDALSKSKLGAWEYDIIYPGFKNNMTDIAAALGISQLRRYEKILQRRREIVLMYNKFFDNHHCIDYLRHKTDKYESSYHLYICRIDRVNEKQRNQIIKLMASKGIACNVHYKPLAMFTAYKDLGFYIDNFPDAYEKYKNEITLPLHTMLTDEQVSFIALNFIEVVNYVQKNTEADD